MKRIFILAIISVITYSANAQFHIEIGLDFNLPLNDFSENYEFGAGLYVEPKYAISDKIDLGLYMGANGFAGSNVGTTSGEVDATIAIPILATATYRFLSNKITPYAGIGIGIYSARIINYSESLLGGSNQTEENVSEFGFAPRAGVYIGRMNLGVIYNSSESIDFFQFNLGVRILDRD
jgi:opacity protein-like surface antigen